MQSPALMRTVDDPDAETFLGGMDLVTTDKVGLHLHWRAGKTSTFMNLGFHGATSESTVYFSGNGGGRHYLVEPQSPAGTREHRHVRIVGTSEPLSWYGCNLEAGGKVAANMEMVNARNVRIYGIKREGRSPTLIVKDCQNIGVFAEGALRGGPRQRLGWIYSDWRYERSPSHAADTGAACLGRAQWGANLDGSAGSAGKRCRSPGPSRSASTNGENLMTP